MIALLDLGNSRLKGALSDKGGFRDVTAQSYGAGGPLQATKQWLEQRVPFERLVVSNVLGAELARDLADACTRAGFPAPEFVATPTAGCGVRVGYSRADQLGVDRFLGLVAARRYYPGPCVTVDCGTAVTIDGLDAEGAHRGGLILPGLELLARSLVAGTALEDVSIGAGSFRLFASSTSEAVRSGALLGLAGAIDRICAEMTDALGGVVRIILTGGDASALRPMLRRDYQSDDTLVLKGLAIASEGMECAS